MKKKYLLLLSICCFGLMFGVSFALDLNSDSVKNIHNTFVWNLEGKYTVEEQKDYLENLNKRFVKLLLTNNLDKNKKVVVEALLKLGNERIFELDMYNYNDVDAQIVKEKLLIDYMKKTLKISEYPDYIKKLLWKNIKFLSVNEDMEFASDWEEKRIKFTKYYKLDSSNYSSFVGQKGYVVSREWTNTFWFVKDYSIETKIPYSKLWDYVKFSFNDETNFFLEGDSYYTYSFFNYRYFNSGYGVYKSDLEEVFWDFGALLLYKDVNGRYNFIEDYKKIKLIKADILFWVTDKIKFLSYLSDDKKELDDDTDSLFTDLKRRTGILVNGKSEEEKIRNIYAYLLNNIEYPNDFSFDDKELFSWIHTYKNKEGVCMWYAKLMSYMLMFADVFDSELIKWHVIDSQDFPKVWHAWVKIWDYYYDPTFDDPVWADGDRGYEEYKYYKLPRDLFYANRYDYWNLPSYLEKESKAARDTLVAEKLSNLVDKYMNQDYILLRLFKFKKKYSIRYDKVVTVENLKWIMNYGEVNNYVFKWKRIKSLRYYKVSYDNVENILEQLGYDLDWIYLFKWNLGGWSYEYRVAYDVKFG